MNKTSGNKLITPEEAATILAVSNQTIWRYMKNGTLNSVKIGKFRRFYAEEVDKMAETNNANNRLLAERR
jgi:excisionase family DNA binding protein